VLKAFLLLDNKRFHKNASQGWNGRKRTISWHREIDIQRVGKEAQEVQVTVYIGIKWATG